MKTREYVECLLKNYNEILKDIDQLKFEYKAFKDIKPVIKELFLEKSTWNKVALKCFISEKILSKYKNRGIDEITKMFDLGRVMS